jgi:acyl carrier protein
VEEIISWLKEKNPELSGEIPADADLIETRMIESLNFLEFICLLEEISGKLIDIGSLSVDDFRTLERIGAAFLDD